MHAYLREIDRVGGGFYPVDREMFRMIGTGQPTTGDILEIGTYLGKSAILLAYCLKDGEALHVCDPFEDPPSSEDNASENRRHYPELARREFERNYMRFHKSLPVIHQTTSDRLQLSRNFRLIHVDGSHLYRCVKQDLDLAKRSLIDGGIVIVDDFRAAHTPGVAAAVWEAVARNGLIPLFLTRRKMYATWGTRIDWSGQIDFDAVVRRDKVLGHEVVLVATRKYKPIEKLRRALGL